MKRLLAGSAAVGAALFLGLTSAGAEGVVGTTTTTVVVEPTVQEYPNPTPAPTVGSTSTVQDSTTSTTARPPVTVRPRTETRGGTLPVTGGDVVGLAAMGAGAVAAGGALLAARRRSARASR